MFCLIFNDALFELESSKHKLQLEFKAFKLIANDELGSRCLRLVGDKCNKQRGGIHGNPGSENDPKNGR